MTISDVQVSYYALKGKASALMEDFKILVQMKLTSKFITLLLNVGSTQVIDWFYLVPATSSFFIDIIIHNPFEKKKKKKKACHICF